MIEIGWRSAPIIILTSFFTGMVLSLQTGSATTNILNDPIYVGTITGFSLTMELGSVLTAVANIIGIYGGMILTTSLWEVSSSSYWPEVLDFMRASTFFTVL